MRLLSTVLGITAFVTAFVCLASPGFPQPDPRQMSGIPLPAPELPDGTITVRVVRGSITNNVPNHPVELRQGDVSSTAMTDEAGRAQFVVLSAGEDIQAVTTLDGQRLESQRFPAPGRGGVRLVLAGAAGDPTAPAVPAPEGLVTFGGESKVLVEVGEETVEVYYLFEITNPASVPVQPPAPLVFDLPSGAQGATILRDSTARAQVDGPRITVRGPFQPGVTVFSAAYVLPYSGDSVAIAQRLPADLEGLFVIAEQRDNIDIVSSQIQRRSVVTPDETGGGTYILGGGPPIAAGATLAFELTGLPHRTQLPSRLAIALAGLLLAAGAWGALGSADERRGTGRRRELETRREQLFGELVKIETQHRTGKVGPAKYASRRQELMTALERVYQELDEEMAPVIFGPAVPVRRDAPVAGRSQTGA